MKLDSKVAMFAAVALASAGATARGNNARVEVARLDGEPVYHWRVFHSRYSNDIDRALIIREFHRRNYKLPQYFVDKSVADEAATHFVGDKHRFRAALKREGVTLDDYKHFVAEEIILAAMTGHEEHAKGFSHDQWIAALRKKSRIERLR